MLRFLRPADPVRTVNAHNNPAYFEDGKAAIEFHPPTEEYGMTHTIPSKNSPFNPPTHIHLNQAEHFLIRKGQGTWCMPRNANPALRVVPIDGSNPDEEARKVVVPVGEYHSFSNTTEDTPLVVSVKLVEEDAVMEERFFRNFFGYIDDCRMAKSEPSVFQLMRFLYEFDCPIAVPIPGPNWLGVAVSRAVCGFMGVIVGEGLLGYKGNYVEYYNPKSSK